MNFVKTIQYDIAVAGGGVAGIAAAVEAARAGKKVVLFEKATQLGGLATIGLINLFVPMCNGRGTQIIKGMADEMLRLSYRYGWDIMPEEWKNGEPGQGKSLTRLSCRYSAPIFALALCEMLVDAGVDIMFDTVLTGADMEDGHIRGVHVFNKSGHIYCKAEMFVDATGDSDLLHFAGVPTVTGGNYHTYLAFGATVETCKKVVEKQDMAYLKAGFTGGSSSLYGTGHPEGKPLWDGTDGDQVSRYLIENQTQMLEKLKKENRKTRDITMLPIMPQFRTTRHIDGNYTLKESDAYKHFDDSICAICDFSRRDLLFEVSYGTMVKDGFDNVLASGRCASAEGFAWDILRVIPPAILTGQAAGAAASQAIDSGKAITDIDVTALQDKLESENVMIHFDDSWIPAPGTEAERAEPEDHV